MSRFRKLSQSIWHCQYHIVWVSKYRYKVLVGKVAEEMENCIRTFSAQQGAEIIELKQRPYWGNHFRSRGYCVDTVGLDSEMIRRYLKH